MDAIVCTGLHTESWWKRYIHTHTHQHTVKLKVVSSLSHRHLLVGELYRDLEYIYTMLHKRYIYCIYTVCVCIKTCASGSRRSCLFDFSRSLSLSIYTPFAPYIYIIKASARCCNLGDNDHGDDDIDVVDVLGDAHPTYKHGIQLIYISLSLSLFLSVGLLYAPWWRLFR